MKKLLDRHGDVVTRAVERIASLDDVDLSAVRPFGCGIYGCAFPALGSRFAVKLTIDEQEGRMWSFLRQRAIELLRDGKRIVAQGMPRIVGVKEITRNVPKVKVRKKQRRVFVIVREEVEPYEVDESQRGRRGRTSKSRPLHAGEPSQKTLSLKRRGGPLTRSEADRLDRAIEAYRKGGWTLNDSRRKDDEALEAVKSRMREAARDLSKTKVGRPLGLLLLNLAKDDVYLLDLHFGNVGWRMYERIEGFPKFRKDVLVALDPGQTTVRELLRKPVTHLSANPSEADWLPDYAGHDEVEGDEDDEDSGWVAFAEDEVDLARVARDRMFRNRLP